MGHKIRIFLFCFSRIGVGEMIETRNPIPPYSITSDPTPDFCSKRLRGKIWGAYLIAKNNLHQRNVCKTIGILTGLFETNFKVDAFYKARLFSESTSRVQTLNGIEQLFEEVVRILRTHYNITSNPSQKCVEKSVMSNTVNKCNELFTKNCASEDKYRSLDGSCNNLRHPTWGMATSCFERLLPPVYSDGISKLRKAVSGTDLPNPRKLSVLLHPDVNETDNILSQMFMLFGQFIAHDMTASPFAIKRNAEVNCCKNKTNHPKCIPVYIKKDDPFYPAHGITCISAFRTASCSTCSLGPRGQTNAVTAFIDGSMIYGLTKEESDKLRNLDGTGTLKSRYFDESGELPPNSFRPSTDGCSFQAKAADEKCFQAGDSRTNMHSTLTTLHIIFLRQHNRLARKLQTTCDLDEETTFQEARRILIAQLQMITYGEYLPILLGPTRLNNLIVSPELLYTEYKGTINPTAINEFAAGAFRFAHTQVNGGNSEDPEHTLGKNFNFPFPLYRAGIVEHKILTLLQFPAQTVDRYVTDKVTNLLYKLREQDFGLDLVMLDIFRGRDHVVPPYVQMVKFCGGPDITSFDQLDELFYEGYAKLFQEAYESVEDIDLFSGGLAEEPTDSALVGQTFACIIEIQFYRTKFGDRFYFEHGQQAGSFTPGQLLEIKKTKYSKILCENSDIKNLQKDVFLLPKDWNPNVSCSDLYDLNLNAWCPKQC